MEWNLSTSAAAVIISAMGLGFGAIMKIFPKKETSEVVDSFMKSIKEIMLGQTDLLNKQNITITLMNEKVIGSHDKLNLMQKYVGRMMIMEEKIDKIRINTAKD